MDAFLSSDVVLEFFRLHLIHIFKSDEIFTHAKRERVCSVQESKDSAKECWETDSVLFCGGLL